MVSQDERQFTEDTFMHIHSSRDSIRRAMESTMRIFGSSRDVEILNRILGQMDSHIRNMRARMDRWEEDGDE